MPYQTGVSTKPQSNGSRARSRLAAIILAGTILFFGVLELVAMSAIMFGYSNWVLADAEGVPKNFAVSMFIIGLIFQAGAYLVGYYGIRMFNRMRRGEYSDLR